MGEKQTAPIRAGEAPPFQQGGFDTLRELARHGYSQSKAPAPHSSGILVKHEAGPDLIVYADGRIELPANQPPKARHPAFEQGSRRISWRRGLLLLLALIVYTFVSAVVTINLIAD